MMKKSGILPFGQLYFGKLYFGLLACLGLLVYASSALACVGEAYPGDHYGRFFRQDMSTLPGRGQLYAEWPGGKWAGGRELESGNYADWQAQLPNASEDDVTNFVYKSTLEDLNALQEALKTGSAYEGSLKGNAFAAHILEKKDRALLEYMRLAKESAPLFIESDDWDYSAPDAELLARLSGAAEKALQSGPTAFLRLRYTYQAIRLNFRQGNNKRCAELFEDLERRLARGRAGAEPEGWRAAESEVLEWCRSYYAGALRRQGENAKAFVQFARVFQKSDRYRQAAYISCRWISGNYDLDVMSGPTRAALTDALNAAATPEERRNVLIIGAYLESFGYLAASKLTASKSSVEKEYVCLLELLRNAGPESPLPPDVEIIWGRMLNHFEQVFFDFDILQERLRGVAAPDYAKEALAVAREKIAVLGPAFQNAAPYIADQAFAGLALSYMSLLQDDREGCTAGLRLAQKALADQEKNQGTNPGKNTAPNLAAQAASQALDRRFAQYRLQELLADAFYAPLESDAEARILKGLNLLLQAGESDRAARESDRAAVENDQAGEENYDDGKDWADRAAANVLTAVLAPRYNASGQTAHAVLCVAAAEKFTVFARPWNVTGSKTFNLLDNLEPNDFAGLQNFVHVPSSDFEHFLANGLPDWFNDANAELRGIKALRRGEFAAAEHILRQGVWENKLIGEDVSGAFAEPMRAYGAADTQLKGSAAENIAFQADKASFEAVLREGMQAVQSGQAGQPGQPAQAAQPEQFSAMLLPFLPVAVLQSASPTADKLDYARQMLALDLLRRLPSDTGVMAEYIRAKGLYNATYDGNAWQLSRWERSSHERWEDFGWGYHTPDPAERPTEEYYRADKAREGFERVVARGANPELRARALFMAAMCTRGYTQMFMQERDASGNNVLRYGPYVSQNPYFKRLMEEYGNSAFVRDAAATCSFLGDYISLNRKK